MDRPRPNFAFKFMALEFRIRDFFFPRMKILKEVGIKEGYKVLDYGCGPGGYVPGLAELVGKSGMVYALDIHPIAVNKVEKLAKRKNLSNVKTILSDCDTGLPDGSLNVALLYDIYHDFTEPGNILKEIHRVLKPDGILSMNDHHLKDEEIISAIEGSELFRLLEKGKKTVSFSRLTDPTAGE